MTTIAWPDSLDRDQPQTWAAPGYEQEGCTALFYEGVPWKGRPTRIFAFTAFPEKAADSRLPGIVLVHGGGGTAFPRWAREVAGLGYAVIAMDTCGCTFGGSHGARPRHEPGGPPGCGGFDTLDDPPEDHWVYHAVAAVLRGRALLAADSRVDPDRIGVWGISWGGFLTAIAASVSTAFAAAVSVYGSGFLGEYQDSPRELISLPEDKRQLWSGTWDASRFLPSMTAPMLWVNSTADMAFPLPAWQRSQDLARGPLWRAIHRDLIHSHETGTDIDEVRRFFDSRLRNGSPLGRIAEQHVVDGNLVARCTDPEMLRRAFLHWTPTNEPWRLQRWCMKQALLDGDRIVTDVPGGAKAAYIECIDSNGMTITGPVVFATGVLPPSS